MKMKLFSGRALIGGLAVMAMTLAPALTGSDTAEAKRGKSKSNNGKHLGWSKGKHKGWSHSNRSTSRRDWDDDRWEDRRESRRTERRWRNTSTNRTSYWRLIDTNHYNSRSAATRAAQYARSLGRRATMSWDNNRDQWMVRIYQRR